jgi:hypothetical protein
MHRLLRPLAGLTLATLLLAAPGLALAHGAGPQQTVDGYLVTLVVPEKGWYTGSNPVEVILWDARGMAVDATVTVAPLTYAPADDGHGGTHTEAEPAHSDGLAAPEEAHADGAAHDDAAAHAASGTHAENGPAHSETAAPHLDDHSSDGRGLMPVAAPLVAGEEPDVYAGELSFDRPGAYTLGVVFTIEGEERGALFEVAVAQSRPRGLVLGGFALVNALAVGAAYVIRRRTPTKATKPARPAPATTTSPEE